MTATMTPRTSIRFRAIHLRQLLRGRLPPSPRRVQERSVETRARLVECAIECLAEQGYAGATTPLIAQRAGVTRTAEPASVSTRATSAICRWSERRR